MKPKLRAKTTAIMITKAIKDAWALTVRALVALKSGEPITL
jgi:hypothetical protein